MQHIFDESYCVDARYRIMPLVASSAVHRVHHDPETLTLDIWYKGGDRYSYFGVPAALYRALLGAESVGAFVNLRIKPHFRYELEAGRRRFRPG